MMLSVFWFFPPQYHSTNAQYSYLTTLSQTFRGSNPAGGENFRTRPDQFRGPTSLLCYGYRFSLPGVKRPVRGVDHPPPFSVDVEERVELCLYSLSGP